MVGPYHNTKLFDTQYGHQGIVSTLLILFLKHSANLTTCTMQLDVSGFLCRPSLSIIATYLGQHMHSAQIRLGDLKEKPNRSFLSLHKTLQSKICG